MLDILIKNGIVYDGTLRDGVRADVGIVGDVIQAVGDLRAQTAREILDATDLAVCPGFLDAHSHSDFSALALGTSDSKVAQGVTTEIVGNCGVSAAPALKECKAHLQESNAALPITVDWEDVRGYAKKLSGSGISLNIVPLVGQGNLRASVVGYADRAASAAEMETMKELLREMMRQGAWGMSTGLIYPPGIFSSTEELIELGEVLGEFGGVYTTHMRSEGDKLLEAIEEAVAIGKAGKIGVQISHLKTARKRNWHKLDSALAGIEKARSEGVNVMADRYPYTASSTDLDSIFPAWVFDGGNAREIERLEDAATFARIREESLANNPEKDCWDNIMIASVETESNRRHEGKMVAQYAKELGREPLDAVRQLLLEERLKVAAIFFSMSEDNLHTILKQPYCMIGSDSSSRAATGPMSTGKPHPRSYGTFPRVIAEYVRRHKLLSLPEAIHKMTLLPARRFGIPQRGLVQAGMMADLVVFDPQTIEDAATFQNPHQYPRGIPWVLVNGAIVMRKGAHTGARSGRVLLRSA